MKQHPVAAIQKHNKLVHAKNLPRNKMILDLRIAGMSEQAIADEMTSRGWPISDTSVHRIVCAALDRENKLLDMKAEQLVRHELDRLDKMTASLFAQRNDPRVADTLLRIMERRAKYRGLDSPIKIDTMNTNKNVNLGDANLDLSKLSDEKLEQLLTLMDEATNGGAK
jgi:hypothetical protein